MKAIASALLLLGLTSGGAALAQAPAEGSEPTLTVQGSGEVRIVPDLATVQVGISEQAPTAEAAQQAVNAAANAILEAILDAGIDERHIQTARLMLTPIYSRQRPDANETPRIEAYRASNTVSVRVEDLSRVGEVIDAALGAGANQLEGVSFGLRDDLPAREDALRRAITEARRKAEAMAGALGVELEAVISVNEGGVFVQQPFMTAAREAVALQQDFSTPVSPGEVTVGASVSIQYRIAEP